MQKIRFRRSCWTAPDQMRKRGVAQLVAGVENGAVFRNISFCVLTCVVLCAGICAGQEEHEHAGGRSSATVPVALRMDVNHASVDELMKVPGMTKTWALRIVKYRPYRTKLDLLEQGIVPGNIYSKIRDYVVAHKVDESAK